MKRFYKKIFSVAAFGLTGTNIGNACYAYGSGPYSQRRGFLEPNTNRAVVFSNSVFSFGCASYLMFKAFK